MAGNTWRVKEGRIQWEGKGFLKYYIHDFLFGLLPNSHDMGVRNF